MEDLKRSNTAHFKATGTNVWGRLGLGTWKCDKPDVTTEIVYQALKAGYRHIDCACDYGNEKDVGRGIQKAIDEGIITRQQIWVTSKLWCTFHKKEHVELACRKSLSDLGLDYLDLYLIHFPISCEYVPIDERYPPHFDTTVEPEATTRWARVPLHETWRAMEDLVDEMLTTHIGVSNFDLQLLQDLLTYCRIRPFVNQIELHPYLQQCNLVRFCANENIMITAYSPFGSQSYIPLGIVPEKERSLLEDPVLQRIAHAHNKSVAQVIIRWILQYSKWLTVIPKSSSIKHLKENIDVLGFRLNDQDMKEIEKLNRNRRYNDPAVFGERMFNNNYLPIFS